MRGRKKEKGRGGGEKKIRRFLFSLTALPRPLLAPFDTPHFLLSSWSFNMALSRVKLRAQRKCLHCRLDWSRHWFTRRYLHFQVKNTPLKDADGKEKFKIMLSFLLLDKGRLFFTKLSFEEFEIQKMSVIGALGLFWNAIKQRSFWRIIRYILYSLVKKITFLKRELCISKYLMLDVLYILRSAWAPWFEICVE